MVTKLISIFARLFFYLKMDRLLHLLKSILHQTELIRIKRSLGKVGEGFSILESSRIINPGFIYIGNNFNALARLRIEVFDQFEGQSFQPKVTIGDNVTINPDCHIACINEVSIHDNVLIASKVFITDHFHGDATSKYIKMPPAKRPLVSKGAVIIKKNVWLGDGVCIMPGVIVGENCIIGANSVVTKSIPDNSVAAGIPCRVIRQVI